MRQSMSEYAMHMRQSMSEYERGVIDGRQMQVQSSVDKAVNAMAAQRLWQGLTDGEKQEWIDAMPYHIEPRHCMVLVNVMEAKLKERNA
jgi:predicted ATPase